MKKYLGACVLILTLLVSCNVHAQETAVLASLSSTTGYVGDVIVITGTGFENASYIQFDMGAFGLLRVYPTAYTTTTLTFEVPYGAQDLDTMIRVKQGSDGPISNTLILTTHRTTRPAPTPVITPTTTAQVVATTTVPAPVVSQPNVPTPVAVTAVCTEITKNLFSGMKHNDVSTLQSFLKKGGFLSVEPTGYFGALTLKAVKEYQKSVGVSATGYVGPLTRQKLKVDMCK